MALFIQGFGVSGREVPTRSGWNTRLYPFGFERGAEIVAIITFITKQMGSALKPSVIAANKADDERD